MNVVTVRCDICATSREAAKGRRGIRRKRERGVKSRRVALQRLDYGESGWTVSLAPWHTAAAVSSSPLRHTVSFLLRWFQRAACVQHIHERKRCAERVDCTLHTCRTARWCTLRHICKLLDTCARFTPARFSSLRARGLDYIGYKTYWDRWNERVTNYRYPRFAACPVLFCPDVFLYLFDIWCTVIGINIENN